VARAGRACASSVSSADRSAARVAPAAVAGGAEACAEADAARMAADAVPRPGVHTPAASAASACGAARRYASEAGGGDAAQRSAGAKA
jgi:hypothetical protein